MKTIETEAKMNSDKNLYGESEREELSYENMRALSERLFLDSRRYDSNMGEQLWNV